MGIIKYTKVCHDCKAEISDNASVCPHCGVKQSTFKSSMDTIIGLILFVGLLLLIGFIYDVFFR